ncbi:MAG: hypothetical protein ACOVOV_04515, partial [Dolichospermum sp.]
LRIDDWTSIHHLEYQVSTNPGTWVVLPASTNLPAISTGYITMIKWVMRNPFPANTSLSGYNQIYFKGAYEPLTPETITNCFTWNSTTAGIPVLANRRSCNSSATLQPRPSTSKSVYLIRQVSNCNLSIGDMVTYKGTHLADPGFSNATNPISAFLVPHGFQYNSFLYLPQTSGITTTPTLQIIPNYISLGGVMKDLYRFTFPNGTVLPYDTKYEIILDVKATAALTPGVFYNADYIATASNSSNNTPEYSYGSFTDTNDWDLDGNTTETFERTNSNYYHCDVVMNASASMTSIKWVKGQLDANYSRYPQFGYTVPGGLADYKLIVKNDGNIPMKDIKIVDIMPWIGDIGVIDLSARNTQWRPNLAGPINAPSGITVYYTLSSNP